MTGAGAFSRLPGAIGDVPAEGAERGVRCPGALGHELRSLFTRGFSPVSFLLQVLGGCSGQGQAGASGACPAETVPGVVVELSDERLQVHLAKE